MKMKFIKQLKMKYLSIFIIINSTFIQYTNDLQIIDNNYLYYYIIPLIWNSYKYNYLDMFIKLYQVYVLLEVILLQKYLK